MDKKPVNKKKLIGIIVLIAAIVIGVVIALVMNHNKNKDNTTASGNATGDEAASLDYDALDYVTVGDYEGIEAYYVTPTVTDDQIQNEIDTLISDNIEYKEVQDTAIQSGDKITIDFVGKIDGEEFDGGSDTDYEYIVDDGGMIDGFDAGLIGLKTGETTTLNLTFPEDYQTTDVAGKDVVFDVTIKTVKQKQADPEWTDAFCKKISDGKYTTTKAYEASIKEDLMSDAKDTSDQTLKSDVWSAVVDNMTVEGYPEALYNQMKESISSSVESTASNYGMEADDYMQAVYGMSVDDYVKQYVQQNLISEALIKTIGITVSDEEYQTMAEDLMTQTGASSVSDLEDYYGKDTIEEYFQNSKLYDYLVEKANVKEVSQTEYDKLTGTSSDQ